MLDTKWFETNLDAGIGLIMRLNSLWAKADRASLGGEFDEWNFIMDRIYCNLLYREKPKFFKTETGVIEFRPAEVDAQVFELFNTKIKKMKIEMKAAKKKKDVVSYNLLKENYYRALMYKDIWLRKMMYQLGLYLKEASRDPTAAMWAS